MRLETFYSSKAWTKFVQALKIERADDNGVITCAHCGRPIVKAYDCIGHHKIRLTEDNVNDYAVSLNPDNVELIHFRCHNEIHQRFDGFRQQVFLVYGSPKAGKSTWVNDNAYADDLIVDVERLWQCVCNGSKPNRVKANVFGLRDALIDQIRTRNGQWRNAYVVGGYPLRTDRERLCDLLGATPVFIDTPKEICLKRAGNDTQYVEEWFENYVE